MTFGRSNYSNRHFTLRTKRYEFVMLHNKIGAITYYIFILFNLCYNQILNIKNIKTNNLIYNKLLDIEIIQAQSMANYNSDTII